jgi:acyl carrier protein
MDRQRKDIMQKQVIAEFAQHLGVTPQDIDLSASLAEDLGIGPVEMADLINFMSEKFKVTFHRSDIQNLRTVNDLVVAIEDLSLE